MSSNHTIKKKVAPAADASPHREDPREALAAVQRAAERATLDLMASASGDDPASLRPQLVGAPVPSTEKPTRFHSLTYPQHPLPAYVASIAKRCQFCDHVIAYALSLLLRSHAGGRRRLTAHMLHRGMLACLYAAHKMLWDRCFSAASYGRLVGISTREVVRCERFLMQLLDWRLFLSQCDIDRALHHAIAGTDVPCGAAATVVTSAKASRRSSENTETEHELPSRMPSDLPVAGESKSASPSGQLHQQQHQLLPSSSAPCAERLKDALNFSASPHDA